MRLDFLGARIGFLRAEFESVEGAFPREPIRLRSGHPRLAFILRRCALQAEQISPSAHGGHERVEAQTLVIVDVLIAQREAGNALAQEDLQLVFEEILVAKIGETIREQGTQANGTIRLAKQECAAVAGKMAAGKIHLHAAATECLKCECGLVTACGVLSRVHVRGFCRDNQRHIAPLHAAQDSGV